MTNRRNMRSSTHRMPGNCRRRGLTQACPRCRDIPESYIGVVTAGIAIAATAEGFDFTIIVRSGLDVEGIRRVLKISIRPIFKHNVCPKAHMTLWAEHTVEEKLPLHSSLETDPFRLLPNSRPVLDFVLRRSWRTRCFPARPQYCIPGLCSNTFQGDE